MRILNIFKLSVARIKKNNIIESLPKDFNSIKNPLVTFSDFSNNITLPFFRKHHIKIDSSLQLEKLYLYGIVSLLIEYNYEVLASYNKAITFSVEVNQNIYYTFIENLELLLGKNLNKKDKKYIEYNFIANLLRFKIFRTTQTINPINFDIETHESMNPSQIISEKVLKNCTIYFPNLTYILLDKLFLLRTSLIIRRILPEYIPVVKIAILSKSGNLYIDILKHQLKQFNFGKIEFKDINIDNDIDILISDYRISTFRYKKVPYSHTLICTYPLGLKEIQIIFKVIEQINQDKYNQI